MRPALLAPRPLRAALALSTVAVLAASGVAGAAPARPAPKPVCNLVVDAAGDTTGPTDALDVVSADIASDARRVTAVLRVRKLATTDGTAPTGTAYSFRFKVAGSAVQYYLLGSIEPAPVGATTFEFGTIETGNSLTPIGDATGKVDVARNEVRISAPLSFGSARLKPGVRLVDLQAFTQRRFVVLLSGADSTVIDPRRSYTTGTRSCVKPGA